MDQGNDRGPIVAGTGPDWGPECPLVATLDRVEVSKSAFFYPSRRVARDRVGSPDRKGPTLAAGEFSDERHFGRVIRGPVFVQDVVVPRVGRLWAHRDP
jgi:hypothetical protein